MQLSDQLFLKSQTNWIRWYKQKVEVVHLKDEGVKSIKTKNNFEEPEHQKNKIISKKLSSKTFIFIWEQKENKKKNKTCFSEKYDTTYITYDIPPEYMKSKIISWIIQKDGR